ncbi:MAG TPA: DUF4386 domain-containing protein [Candidatus Cybelea sp.]|nr:DUF4386 domain-containing protein [Candidatus Cybelea sp.]
MIGIFYILLFASGLDQYVFRKLVVRGDAAVTATNIQSHQTLWLAGFAAALLGIAFYLVITALFYRLFTPVSRTLSLCAAFFSLTGCIIQAFALVFRLMPLIVLGDSAAFSAFQPDQLHALALISLNSYVRAYDISLVFFGFYLLQLAYLVFRSTFLPRWLAPVVALGLGWSVFLYPPLARALSPYVALSSVGEVLLVLWLLVKGVDEQRWHEQATRTRAAR